MNPRLIPVVDFEMFTAEVWRWAAPENWCSVSGRPASYSWSDAMSEPEAASALRERIVAVDDLSMGYFVIYGRGVGGVRLILFKAKLQAFEGFGTSPPDWWLGDDLSPLQMKLARVQVQLERIDSFMSRRRGPSPSELRGAPVAGYCKDCGLPTAKHVAHDPPGVKAPPRDADVKLWHPWLKALTEHYWAALKSLTDYELLEMPLIINKRRLRVLEMEIKDRLEDTRHQPMTKLDRLLERDVLSD